MKMVDVSQWQGVIDWNTVKPHIAGAILRAGYGKGVIDAQFHRNAAECNRLGIPCGAYWFSYATTQAEAKAEANYLLQAVKPHKMELPLAFDFEYNSVNSANMHGVSITKELATRMVYAFCETIEAGGYWCLNYANPDFLANYFTPDVPQRFGLWLAQWPGGAPDLTKKPRPDVQIWQWTSAGSIPGIAGNVDTNESYTDFAKLIRESNGNRLEDQPANAFTYDNLEWCKAHGIAPDNVTASTTVTWGDLANVLRKTD